MLARIEKYNIKDQTERTVRFYLLYEYVYIPVEIILNK